MNQESYINLYEFAKCLGLNMGFAIFPVPIPNQFPQFGISKDPHESRVEG